MDDLPPAPSQGTALTQAARANDVVLIADVDHADDQIAATIANQLPAMQAAGVRHLYLEHDAKDVSLQQLRDDTSQYGAMVRTAESLGITVHEFDDRRAARAVDERYPQEAKFAYDHDAYFDDPDRLAATAPNQERMQAYLTEKKAELGEIDARNDLMLGNLSRDMQQHSTEKAIVIVGADHANRDHDLDEGLRSLGFHTTSIEINSTQTIRPAASTSREMFGTDRPDFIVAAETGQAVSYKDPTTQKIKSVMAGIELPWRNTEPVVEHTLGESVSPSTQGTAPVMARGR